jgi:hypothetical protein
MYATLVAGIVGVVSLFGIATYCHSHQDHRYEISIGRHCTCRHGCDCNGHGRCPYRCPHR